MANLADWSPGSVAKWAGNYRSRDIGLIKRGIEVKTVMWFLQAFRYLKFAHNWPIVVSQDTVLIINALNVSMEHCVLSLWSS